MTIYCKIKNGIVVDRAVFDGEMPSGWDDGGTWVASEEAQIGWSYSGGSFSAPPQQPEPPPTADEIRLGAIKANSRRVAIINYLNAHTDTEILAYVAANSNTLAKAQTMLGDIALILAAAVRD